MAFRNIPPNGFPAIPDIEDLEAVVKDVSTLKTTTAGLAEDVGDLEDQKANQITIALPFNPETEYEVGDLVYYNGLSYRCTNAHTGEWDADDFAGTTIANELASLKSGLTGLTNTETVTLTAAEGITLENVSITKIGRVMIGSFKMTLSSDVAIFGEVATISKTVSHKAVFPINNGGFCYADDVTNKIRVWQGLNAGTYIVQLVAFGQ